jgi:HEAT repeat protein
VVEKLVDSTSDAVVVGALRYATAEKERAVLSKAKMLLNSPNPIVKQEAIGCVVALEGASAFDVVKAYSKDKVSGVRFALAESLSDIDNAESVKVLHKLQGDSNRAVRRRASISIVGKVEDGKLQRNDVKSIVNKMISSSNSFLKIEALYLVGKLKLSNILPSALSSVKLDTEKSVFIWAAGECKNKDVGDFVTSNINSKDGAIAIQAAVAIGKIGYKPAVEVIDKVLNKTEKVPMSSDFMFSYTGDKRIYLINSLMEIDSALAAKVGVKVLSNRLVAEDIRCFELWCNLFAEAKPEGIEKKLKTFYKNKLVSDEHKLFIVKTIKRIAGSVSDLEVPEIKEKYTRFFIQEW